MFPLLRPQVHWLPHLPKAGGALHLARPVTMFRGINNGHIKGLGAMGLTAKEVIVLADQGLSWVVENSKRGGKSGVSGRPSGRPPKGKVWSAKAGAYVLPASSLAAVVAEPTTAAVAAAVTAAGKQATSRAKRSRSLMDGAGADDEAAKQGGKDVASSGAGGGAGGEKKAKKTKKAKNTYKE